MLQGREFHDILVNIFQDVRGIERGNQLQVNCPKCQEREGLTYPDGKFNLEINTEKRVFRCWKCYDPQFTGTLGKLIKLYGSNIDYELYKSFSGAFFSGKTYEFEEDIHKPIFLPNHFISFSDINEDDDEHLEALNYLILNRGLSREKILEYRLGFCVEGYYKKRIIIPSFDMNGNVNYFVARSYDKNEKVKYLNPKYGKDIVFNEKYINFDFTVFLVEGVFEMLSLPNSTPLLGKEINEALFYKLKERKPDLIIGLDFDAYESGFHLYNILFNIYEDVSHKIKFLKLDDEFDIDELCVKNKDKLLDLIYGAKPLTDNDYFNHRIKYVK